MARKDDIRFDRRPIVVEHESARGEVVRNVGAFTRGSQLIRLRYMMFMEGARWPIVSALLGFVGILVILLALLMREHEVQLVEMHLFSSLWTLVDLDPSRMVNLTLPDETLVPVQIGDVPDYPDVAVAWTKFVRCIIVSFVSAVVLSGPLTLWFVSLSKKIGVDILKQRHERGATRVSRALLFQEITAHNQDRLNAEVTRRFAPEERPLVLQKWNARIAEMACLAALLRNREPGIIQSMPKPDTVSADQEILPAICDSASLHVPYTIADIPYPWRLEQSHTMLIGSTGAGKTTQLRNIVSEARARGQRCVIFDLTGAFVEAFYNPETDYILNPMDERCPPWTIFNDCLNYADYLTAACALIPSEGSNGEPFWAMAARTLFVEMCMKLLDSGETSNGAIAHHLMHADLKEIHQKLRDTIANPLTAAEAARMAESIRAVFNTNAQALRFLPDPRRGGQPPFSIYNWMRNGKSGSILFVTSTRNDLALTRPLLTLWMDMAVNAIMTMPRTMDLRTWYLFDEVHALHRLPAIEHGLQAARNFGGAFMLGMHSIDKLAETYGKEGAVNLTSLARTKLILATPDMNTAQTCSDFIGLSEIRETDEAYSIGASRSRDAATITPRTEVKPCVFPTDLMDLPVLQGYVKFPEGFPAARVELTYVDYPIIAPGFLRKTKMSAAPYVPRDSGDDKPAGDAGREAVTPRTGQMELQLEDLRQAAEGEKRQDPAPVAGPTEVPPDQPQGETRDSVVPAVRQDDDTPQAPAGDNILRSALRSGDDIASTHRASLAKSDSEMRPDDRSASGQTPGQRPEQQIIIEERTGQAAGDPAEKHHRHRDASHDVAHPPPNRDNDMGMEM